ncbi:subtilisin-like serine protease [Striga asiatica]|uniref:Subtilisin-like serine protease n=1 Tax=Striga asiatica TaxID=4170 RepID=A0A5A7R336_STRAF|nr:subtilisin-like serine protease [Striga asiatica]
MKEIDRCPLLLQWVRRGRGNLNSSDYTPRDNDGHGSHTLSTAGGNFVPGANVFGYGNGTAKGGSPMARVAAYKVCWPVIEEGECFDADIIAGFDMAIHDGVDVISASLGGSGGQFFVDGVAIGSFHAVSHGIVVVCSAGNSGPDPGTVSNNAPWPITVAASTMDRTFPSYLILGNKKYEGQSLSIKYLPEGKLFTIIYAKYANATNATAEQAELCEPNSLDANKVRGKILVCLRGITARVDKGRQAALAGAVGMVLANDEAFGNDIKAEAHVLPATHISYKDGVALLTQMNKTRSPKARITKPITLLDTTPAPVMAAFSSQGPNPVMPEILKPDITAPGVSIIAAYTGAVGPTGQDFDKRRVPFNSISGTSMSCPHVAGVVSLLKKLYPKSSPAAIKSAIMTTASTIDNTWNPITNNSNAKATPLNYGGGHIDPNRAMDPGLVYDLQTTDYLDLLCALVPFFNGPVTVTRKVKNVGAPGTYKAFCSPDGISVKVEPDELEFNFVGEEKGFNITIQPKKYGGSKDYVFGELTWSDGHHKSYVVYLGGHSHGKEATQADYDRVTQSHYDFLGSFLGSRDKAKAAIFYSYTRHINGFAATLEENEALQISNHPNVISVFLNRGRKLQTTRSWSFLGLENDDGEIPAYSLWNKSRLGEDVIIANLDSGLKLIGARYFYNGYVAIGGHLNSSHYTPRDNVGHGSHTLSTAGGNFVPGANVFGYGNGTAKGGSPMARVAAYKVCWPTIEEGECFDADIIAGFDMAIHDGVDVISVSLGGAGGQFFEDGVAIGSFHAVSCGIVVVCSAGNSGPDPGTVSNNAPWPITVGASTMDRTFPSYLTLGNKKYEGQSLSNKFLPEGKLFTIIYAKYANVTNATAEEAELCEPNSLDANKVRGKILVCLRGITARVDKGRQAALAGAVGMVLANNEASGNDIEADAHVLPATHISYKDGVALLTQMNKTRCPMARITNPITLLDTKPAPVMAAFSSQGPNPIMPEILKPDITAPGVSIIAAYSGANGPADEDFDTRRVQFNSISGTSMSCPHVAGVVALLKKLYPKWSPAAIKSAIMTTASTIDNTWNPITNNSNAKATPFNYGGGHIDPNRAMDPGLIYDLQTTDYLNFLCALGYNQTQIKLFWKKSITCRKPNIRLIDFNYPSLTVPFFNGPVTVTRKVKNVGAPGTYKASVCSPDGISVKVEPDELEFNFVGEEKGFNITIQPKKYGGSKDYVFGELTWSDGHHKSYVVYLGGHSHGKEATQADYDRVTQSHYDFLGSFLGSRDKAKAAIFYSYTRHINGFAATLEENEALQISNHPNVISVFLNRGRKLQTTRSWSFLGLENDDGEIPAYSLWNKSRLGEDVIIVNLDSGLKLIGARYFYKGYVAHGGHLNSSDYTPRDYDGHGTHTLSTAGGNFVPRANVFGYGNGTAKGGSPMARVAAYKVCWPIIDDGDCFDADILAGFDMAISDGVDVLSVSLAGDGSIEYFMDASIIGSFHAVSKGIVVVFSGGNAGPFPATVLNVAPWKITVGASTIDRKFPSYLKIGHKTYEGQSLSKKSLPPRKLFPIIYARYANAANATAEQA